MDEYIVIQSHKGVFHSSQNKLIISISLNMDESKNIMFSKKKKDITCFTKYRKSYPPTSWKRGFFNELGSHLSDGNLPRSTIFLLKTNNNKNPPRNCY